MADILVVEDDESVRTLLETNLLIKGHNVLRAQSGSECLSILEKQVPNLIVLDLMLPDADGIELLEMIRERPDSERIPVLILTAKGDERDRVRGFAAGADDYLVKPFFSTELLLRIDRLLSNAATGSSFRQLALTDRVTGLGNRSYFETRVEQLKDQSDREDVDLTLMIVDLPALPEQVRKSGWKTTDMVLAKLGSAIKSALLDREEAFWLGTQAVVTSLQIDTAAAARCRLDELKKIVKDCLDTHRRQVSLIPYFGFCFYEPPETIPDLLDKAIRSPYGALPRVAPRESVKKSPEDAVEAAFGGKLTGLAPVDYVPEVSTRRSHRSTGEHKIDKRLALSQISQIAASLEAVSQGEDEDSDTIQPRPDQAGSPKTPSRPRQSSPLQTSGSKTTTTQPIPITQSATTRLPRLDESQVAAALQEVLDEATRDVHDVAVCCLAFEGVEEVKGRLDPQAVESLFDTIATEVATEAGLDRYESAQAFWTGTHLFVTLAAAKVPDAREVAKSLSEAAATKLAPHRLNLKVSAGAGYVFFEFEEVASDLLERAKGSPYKGGVLITPLEARNRSVGTPES